MTIVRKDKKGRNLRINESVMPDGRYRYRYTDTNGKRKAVYSWKLVTTDKVPSGKRECLCLREKEKEIIKNMQDNIDSSMSENATLNDVFEKYISMKTNLKQSTRVNYCYNYKHYIKESLGSRKIKSIRYSDIKSFYNDLLKSGMNPNTLGNIHTILHPIFTLAVRDGIIRNNPSDGVVSELKKCSDIHSEHRHALTIEEQELFINFLKKDKKYGHWLPLMTFFLGTGCRVGEVIGLTWDDIDFETNMISINHNTTYRPDGNGNMIMTINTPKTKAGIRTIPMFKEVRDALLGLKDIQKDTNGISVDKIYENGASENHFSTIQDYSNFVFTNKRGTIYLPMNINKTIKRIYTAANAYEANLAKSENRIPVKIRHFTVHNFRHTFCTRLCEVENNIKLIMSIMRHSNVQTTMNIYN